MTLPEALHAKVVQAIIARKSSWIVPTLFTSLLRLNDVSIGNIHKHGLVLEAITATVHVLKALEAKVILTIGTENLWALDRTRGTQTATSCRERGMSFAWTLASFVQRIETGLAKGH